MSSFSTTMTGEIFNLLRYKSLLTKSIENTVEWDNSMFEKGLKSSLLPGGLMQQLFTVRSLQLSKKHLTSQGEAYLSGILIGSEINAILTEDKTVIAVVASELLMSRYLYALKYFGLSAYGIDSEKATVAGALEIFEQLQNKTEEKNV